ncbi:pyridoxamine 5'-phosphate oxidase family protein [Methylopila musalis]|uniref:Pyridoxamine 5'-phosphate oxidase family protein n=1 Tax=Methylopila musalis TaxID=1134781 RepID=A0ABW3ZBB4_9HYPH
MIGDEGRVTTGAELDALYGAPVPRSRIKEVDHVHPLYRPFIERSPFMVLATAGPGGLDASPRGDAAGFVHIEDERTLLLPDRRGNNRIDSLRNIVEDPRVALLFLIPGVDETLRVNGDAEILAGPDLLARFAVGGQAPRSVLRIRVRSVYFQCARALLRSELWSPGARVARHELPSVGAILTDISRATIDGAEYDARQPALMAATLY